MNFQLILKLGKFPDFKQLFSEVVMIFNEYSISMAKLSVKLHILNNLSCVL